MTNEQSEELIGRAMDANQRFFTARANLELVLNAFTKANQEVAAALEELGVASRLSGAIMIELPELPEKKRALSDVDAWVKASIDCRAILGNAASLMADMAIILHETECAEKDEQPWPLREIVAEARNAAAGK